MDFRFQRSPLGLHEGTQLATNERPVNHNGSAAFHGGEARYSARRRGRRRYRHRLTGQVDNLVLPRAVCCHSSLFS
jgi:hypothetical protein